MCKISLGIIVFIIITFVWYDNGGLLSVVLIGTLVWYGMWSLCDFMEQQAGFAENPLWSGLGAIGGGLVLALVATRGDMKLTHAFMANSF